MALTGAGEVATVVRPIGVGAAMALFARLKLRVLGNGLRGQSWRVGLFALGCAAGLGFAVFGFLLFAAPGLAPADGPEGLPVLFLAVGGALLVLGWILLPLVFFGVDETLDPARFALLPLRRTAVVAGQLTAGLVGVPAAATLVATAGTVVTAGRVGGSVAAATQAVGVLAGLLLCVALSRAVTSSFAGMLRSRRMRDLAAILLAVLAALLGPLQIAAMALLRTAELDRMVAVARVLAWTPLAAPYTAGLDVADGRPLAAAAKLVGTLALTALVLWWWSASLESAMTGTTSAGPRARAEAAAGGPVASLFPMVVRWIPRGPYGAVVAREVRYWWRDARRRAGLITIAVVGVFIPVMFNFGGPTFDGELRSAGPVAVSASMIFIGTLAALSLANQFGYDGSAYAAHLAVGVRGRTELAARVVAYSVYLVPLLTGIAVLVAVLLDRPGLLPAMLGGLAAAYGTGVAINLFISILGAYALPETSNPFAISTGAGVARSLLAFVALLGSLAAAAPFLVGAAVLGEVWSAVALPVGLVYGGGAAALGCYIAGDLLDRRAPELLQTVTPRR